MSSPSRKRSAARRPKKAHRGAPKRGIEYQHAVGDVARKLDPHAAVEVGVWVLGPDGQRDLDVVIRHAQPSVPPVVIECKDWNRPVGIGHIDALESKRRDIGASVAMICSNSGFTADALAKASRVGIPALAALKSGDNRIRIIVTEQIYARQVHFEPQRTAALIHHESLDSRPGLAGVSAEEFSFDGRPVMPWMARELLRMTSSATEGRALRAAFSFKQPMMFQARGEQISVQAIECRVAFRVEWWTQVARLDASHGMYDYLKKRLIMGPEPGQFHMTINSETWGTQVSVSEVPPRFLVPADRRESVQTPAMEFCLFKNFPFGDPAKAAELDPFIQERELEDGEPDTVAPLRST